MKMVRKALLWAVGAMALAGAPGPAGALDETFGEVSVSLDTTVSLGAAFRTQARDCTNISLVNLGCRFGPKLPDFGVPITASAGFPEGGLRTGTRSQNVDDGNLNFEPWDPVASTLKATVELEVSWRNFTFFTRGLGFYDMIYSNDDLAFKQLRTGASDDLGRDFQLLDLFISGHFDAGDVPVMLRVGQQAINWGESLFIPGGINSYLPIDISRLRSPGSEIKEGLLPTPAVFASIGIVPGVDFEAFYQWKHDDSELDPARSYFSRSDLLGAGSSPLLSLGPDFTTREAALLGFPGAAAPIQQGRFTDTGRKDGNFGFSLSYYADWLNQGTELKAYYVNYTSPLPYFTYKAPTLNFEDVCDSLALGGVIPDGFDGGAQSCISDPVTYAPTAFVVSTNLGKYGFDYPDAIQVYGVSFNTQAGKVALAGEVAFYPDLPLQLSDGEIFGQIVDADDSSTPTGDIIRVPLLLSAYTSNGGTGALGAASAAIAATTGDSYAVARPTGGTGDIFRPFRRTDSVTGQLSAITIFAGADRAAQWLGSDTSTLIVNAGFMWVPDMPGFDEAVIAAPGCELGHPRLTTSLSLASGSSAKTEPKCASAFSAGYRAIFSPTYNNAIGAWSISPRVAFRHDLRGRSPGPIGPGFVSGQQQISLGISADLRNRYRNTIEYTNFKGAGTANTLNDRDYLSVTTSIAF